MTQLRLPPATVEETTASSQLPQQQECHPLRGPEGDPAVVAER